MLRSTWTRLQIWRSRENVVYHFRMSALLWRWFCWTKEIWDISSWIKDRLRTDWIMLPYGLTPKPWPGQALTHVYSLISIKMTSLSSIAPAQGTRLHQFSSYTMTDSSSKWVSLKQNGADKRYMVSEKKSYYSSDSIQFCMDTVCVVCAWTYYCRKSLTLAARK